MSCKTLDRSNASPAVVTELSEPAKQQIADTINEVMPGANVRLADDTLSKDNRLFIQRKTTMVDGNPAQGRITEMPRKFELFISNGDCFLVDDKVGDSYYLDKVQCRRMD
ncbi:hypothetical protein [Kangiella shandongensis]|uniref:hypothetical protein n=1 Tax=Kangiella shandongensis TaxID=2763258 RepID=UPI001CBAC5AD|nr:hypothetical protein [Kangiella shandongensis]